ncbi:DUF4270 family protein [uncultured Algibacter sp.]|uniref:DUF4270 family protein n=1 Tax=uncultured Algibacter sp. TaxID=298659 RepID=UPI003217B7FF
MKKILKAIKLSLVLICIVSSFIACDKDFNVIESDVLGVDNTNFSTNIDSIFPISAYNKRLDSLEINNLPAGILGVFNDPAYGLTTASIVTQITPMSFPTSTNSSLFGVNPVIDDVILSIPYFSRVTGVDNSGNSTFTIDSLYGTPNSRIKITIFQNNYFLRNFNPNSANNSPQNYFSNANSTQNSIFTGSQTVNFDEQIGQNLYENDEFIVSNDAIVTNTGTTDEDAVRSSPALRVILPNDDTTNNFWTRTIIDRDEDDVLSNANNFRNYFRGLYIKAESVDGNGNMVLLNLASSDARITIRYTNGPADDRTQNNTYVLNFSGVRVNPIINDFNIPLQNGNRTLGDESLFLKGPSGSMAVVDLFGKDNTGLKDFLDTYRATDNNGEYITDPTTGNFILKRLINEAHLAIYEDETIDTGGQDDFHAFDRLYAYDIKNNTPTIDYQFDLTANQQNPFNSNIISLGQRLTDNNGLSKYKIRLTEHLNNILQRDSLNTQIGLTLSTNVNLTNNVQILNSNDNVNAVPGASIVSPRGTIFYGSNEAVSVDRRLKLKIFFTEPN